MHTFNSEEYKQEVKEKWRNTDAYKEHTEKTKNYSIKQWNSLANELNGIFADFAQCMQNGYKAESDETQKRVRILQKHISYNYYHCTNEILAGLGQMYIYDERFRQNIDSHCEGTAEYVNEAIRFFCTK